MTDSQQLQTDRKLSLNDERTKVANDRQLQPLFGFIPPWLFHSLLAMTIFGVWGIQSKIVVEYVPPLGNQVLTTPGLLVVAFVLWIRLGKTRMNGGRRRMFGILLAFVTGVLGSIGNVAFYAALGQGGMASVVVPMCSLYPVVTVLLALLLLREKVNTNQRIGVVLAVVAIIMLGG